MIDETTRTRPPRFIGRGYPLGFRQARNRVLDRLEEARAAGDEEAARRLEEEHEVLRWKTHKALMPDREVPAEILEKFDKYEDHPPLPHAAALASGRVGEVLIRKEEERRWRRVVELIRKETQRELEGAASRRDADETATGER